MNKFLLTKEEHKNGLSDSRNAMDRMHLMHSFETQMMKLQIDKKKCSDIAQAPQ